MTQKPALSFTPLSLLFYEDLEGLEGDTPVHQISLHSPKFPFAPSEQESSA